MRNLNVSRREGISRRESVLSDWDRLLKKAEKSLEDSKTLYELYGDEDYKQWIEEDQEKVDEVKKQIEDVIKFMDEHNIK